MEAREEVDHEVGLGEALLEHRLRLTDPLRVRLAQLRQKSFERIRTDHGRSGGHFRRVEGDDFGRRKKKAHFFSLLYPGPRVLDTKSFHFGDGLCIVALVVLFVVGSVCACPRCFLAARVVHTMNFRVCYELYLSLIHI